MNCQDCKLVIEATKNKTGLCTKCNHKKNKKARANTPQAKAKRRRNKIFGKYKMTMSQYEAMSFKQSGRCAICLTPSENVRYGVLCVDHSHRTGKVRGLLCIECNTGLGRFEDKLQILINAIHYLKAHQ